MDTRCLLQMFCFCPSINSLEDYSPVLVSARLYFTKECPLPQGAARGAHHESRHANWIPHLLQVILNLYIFNHRNLLMPSTQDALKIEIACSRSESKLWDVSCKRSGYGLGSILRGDVASSQLDQPDPNLLFRWMARPSPGTCPPLKLSLDLRKGKLHYVIISRTISLNATAPKAFVHTSTKFS
jgi:hypothetical protein